MNAVFDGSVVRAPMSGVHVAVRQQLLALLATRLARQAVVYCRDEDVARRAAAVGAALGGLPRATRRVSLRIAWQQVVLPRLLKRHGADVLHALAYTAPRRCPVPYVLNVHDVIALTHPEWCSRANVWHMRSLLPGSILNASACIVSCTHVADELLRLFSAPRERIHRVPLGVDFERFGRPTPRPEHLLPPPPRPYWLFVGNIEPKKGLSVLLEAYATSSAASACDLVIAGRQAWGSGPVIEQVRAGSSAGRVHLTGRVDDADLVGLYQHARAFVFPSLTEGFGLPVLEAMAGGAPVVHSDHPALVETAGGAGLAFPVGDAAELRRCLDRVSESDQLVQELSGKGRDRARQLPWSKWADAAAAILHESARS